MFLEVCKMEETGTEVTPNNDKCCQTETLWDCSCQPAPQQEGCDQPQGTHTLLLIQFI